MMLNDFDGRNSRRILYEMPRHGMHGIHARQFENQYRLDNVPGKSSTASPDTAISPNPAISPIEANDDVSKK